MAKIQLGFAICSNYYHEIDTDDYLDSEEWDNMTTEEKSDWIQDREFEFQREAESYCSESLAELTDWEDLDTGENHYYI